MGSGCCCEEEDEEEGWDWVGKSRERRPDQRAGWRERRRRRREAMARQQRSRNPSAAEVAPSSRTRAHSSSGRSDADMFGSTELPLESCGADAATEAAARA